MIQLNIVKIVLVLLIIYILGVFLVKFINIDNINIKSKNKLIDFDKEYKLPETNLRGRNLTKLEK